MMPFSEKSSPDILKEEGYQVETASSGNEALAMLETNSYQLVVTDMVLQDISGLDILSRAKQMDSDIEVIVVTGYGNMESAIYALKNGARDYLVKPISHDEFKHVVRLSMEQRRLLDENQGLKDQIRLFQTCQTIANCIDIDRIQSLVLEATMKESGAERGFTCLRDAARKIFLMEAKGYIQGRCRKDQRTAQTCLRLGRGVFHRTGHSADNSSWESTEGKTDCFCCRSTIKQHFRESWFCWAMGLPNRFRLIKPGQHPLPRGAVGSCP